MHPAIRVVSKSPWYGSNVETQGNSHTPTPTPFIASQKKHRISYVAKIGKLKDWQLQKLKKIHIEHLNFLRARYGVPSGLACGGGCPPLPGGVDINGITPAIAWSVATGLQQDLKCAMYPHAVQECVCPKSKPSQVKPGDSPGACLWTPPMDPTYGPRLCHRGMHAHGRTSRNFLECRTLIDSQLFMLVTLRYIVVQFSFTCAVFWHIG